MTDRWAWDDPKERRQVEEAYCRMIHQQYIDEHPEFIPGCECHPLTRQARLELADLK